MLASPIIIVERPIAERLQQLLTEYVVDMEAEFCGAFQDEEFAFQKFSDYLLTSLKRIKKRLGLQKWEILNSNMEAALKTHLATRDLSAHHSWLEPLIVDYYDPMYKSQLESRKQHIIFRGNYSECKHFLNERV